MGGAVCTARDRRSWIGRGSPRTEEKTMTDKELSKLRRDDLLQILINQQKQIDELNAQLLQSKEALANRDIAIQESGTLAEAALKLNGVFDTAQRAAEEYVKQMQRRADELVAEAEKRSEESDRLAETVVRNARAEAERIVGKARSEAESLARQSQQADSAQPRQGDEAAAGDDADGKRRRRRLWGNKET